MCKKFSVLAGQCLAQFKELDEFSDYCDKFDGEVTLINGR